MEKKDRLLEIFYRLLTGNRVKVSDLADEYEVSTKSISRDISLLKNFLADHRDELADVEIIYDASTKSYYFEFTDYLKNEELLALVKVIIGCRAFQKTETLDIINKLKRFSTKRDQEVLQTLISNEIPQFREVQHDCASVMENLWKLSNAITTRNEVGISYYKMNRKYVERNIRPLAITFSDYYFYLIAYQENEDGWDIRFYRVDRIVNIVVHNTRFELKNYELFDEGSLMNRIQLMFPGKTRRIKFEFTGPSVQAILDKLPTAKIVDKAGKKYTIEAEVFGSGVNMFLLSQGSWVKAIAPQEFVDEMKEEIEKMRSMYE